MPERDRELARDDRRVQAGTVLDHLEQVSGLRVGKGPEREVVEDEDVDPGPGRQQAWQPAIGPRGGQLGEQPRHPRIERAGPRPDGRGRESAGEIRLADSRGPPDEDLLVRADPMRVMQGPR